MKGRNLESAVKQRNAIVGDLHKAPVTCVYPSKQQKKPTALNAKVQNHALPVKRNRELNSGIQKIPSHDQTNSVRQWKDKRRKELRTEIQEISSSDSRSCSPPVRRRKSILKKQEISPADRISRLPDSVLLHILSFLKMHDITRTSLLSKRWRYLWTSVTCLDFDFYDPRGLNMSTFIEKSIINHEGPKVQKLCIGNIFKEKSCSALDVDSWIRFAIRRNVEELILGFYGECPTSEWYDPPYKLPQSLFKSRSLTDLTVSFCDINLPASMNLCSLKRLTLDVVHLSINAIKDLTSSCPLLEELVLDSCNCFDNLHIVIENQNVRSLEIRDHFETEAGSEIMIYAPHLVSLCFRYSLPRNYRLQDLQSLLKVSIYDLECDANPWEEYDENDGNKYAQLLGDLQYVKELNLCQAFVKILSTCEVQKLASVAMHATHIQINSNLTKWDLPGISHLLRNSSRLESLTISPPTKETPELSSKSDSSDIEEKGFDFEERGFWKSEEFGSFPPIQNLKTIDMYFCSGTDGERDVDEVLDELENQCEFVEFILKNSLALERMTLNIDKASNLTGDDYETLFKLSEKLLVLPRASSRAEIHFI